MKLCPGCESGEPGDQKVTKVFQIKGTYKTVRYYECSACGYKYRTTEGNPQPTRRYNKKRAA